MPWELDEGTSEIVAQICTRGAEFESTANGVGKHVALVTTEAGALAELLIGHKLDRDVGSLGKLEKSMFFHTDLGFFTNRK